MSLEYFDGFDSYQTADVAYRYYHKTGTVAIVSGGATEQCLRLGSIGSSRVARALSTSSTKTIGFRFKVDTMETGGPFTICQFAATNGHPQLGLAMTSTGALGCYRSTNPNWNAGATSPGTLLETLTDTGLIVATIWVFIEWTVVCADGTGGSFEIRVNNVSKKSGTGLDTSYTSTDLAAVAIGNMSGALTYFDDLYVKSDGSFLGDCTAEVIFPDADGSHSDLLGSDGNKINNYQLVDEQASDFPLESDYVSSATTDEKDTYNYESLGVASATIHGVQVCPLAKKSDAGARTYKTLARLSGDGSPTEGSTSFAPSDTSWAYGCEVWETKPGGGAWGVSDVNGAQFGVVVKS